VITNEYERLRGILISREEELDATRRRIVDYEVVSSRLREAEDRIMFLSREIEGYN